MKKDHAMMRIVIVGGGVSGYLLLMNLIKLQKTAAEIVLLEKESLERVGLAYSTNEDFHLLNVPAAGMSAFPEERSHFVNWLLDNGYDYPPTAFVPRKIYRKYILAQFDQLMQRKPDHLKVRLIRDEAVDVDAESQLLLLKEGAPLHYDVMVLAVGSFPPDALGLANKDYIDSKNYYHSAWESSLYKDLPANAGVFIIGTGLTMVDTVARLHDMKHGGEVIALSRHGLLPATHRVVKPYPSFYEELAGKRTVLEMFKVVRKHLRNAACKGENWRAVIDSLRSHTPGLWMNLPDNEKKTFMQHLRHTWDASRHRMPHESANMMQEMLDSGKTKIVAGRITAIDCNDRFTVSYRERGTKIIRSFDTDVIINCMGPSGNYKNIKSVLVTNLVEKGVLSKDALNLGVNCTPAGAVVGKDGRPSRSIFTLGSPKKGILWETTAVPEIRVQAQELAQHIANNVITAETRRQNISVPL
jgi:uncharacterized NAD(P)/FAD-binding protein YdhS